MKAEIKIAALRNSKDSPLLIAKIRTEHEVIISPETFSTVQLIVNQLSDDSELTKVDGAHFAWELNRVLELFKEYSESPRQVIGRLESDWKPISGFLSLDTLKKLDDSTRNVKSMRIDGDPATGLKIVIQSGTNLIEIPADKERLQSIKSEIEISKELPEFKSSSVAEWLIAIGILIEAGLAIWDHWEREQERKRQREEQKRREEEEERSKRERDCREPRETSSGGAAHDAFIDRISRTA